ncbi:MAG: hypothetical protein LBI13_01830 [Streptococcaceae bacterium]|nr:hypothetical protein [Streptococcaceae bacterium]
MIRYDTIHLIPTSKTMIIPDLYHIVEHSLILVAFVCMAVYFPKNRERKTVKKSY